jgi:hypothetical protein
MLFIIFQIFKSRSKIILLAYVMKIFVGFSLVAKVPAANAVDFTLTFILTLGKLFEKKVEASIKKNVEGN